MNCIISILRRSADSFTTFDTSNELLCLFSYKKFKHKNSIIVGLFILLTNKKEIIRNSFENLLLTIKIRIHEREVENSSKKKCYADRRE